MFEAALEVGGRGRAVGAPVHEVYCRPTISPQVATRSKRFGPAEAARLDWRPRTTMPVGEDDAATLFKLLDALDDSDDVQRVAANFEVADDVLERLSR